MTAGALRVVVIGRDGQVSHSLKDVLARAGHDVIQLGRPEFDLKAPAAMTEAIISARPDIVVNPAAYTAVDKAEDEPELAAAINADGAEAVAKAAAETGAPIVHFSTDYVFDGKKTSPYVESDATGPIGVYGATKLEGERRVASANPHHVILRTAWVCSPFGNNFVKTMLRLASQRPELGVVDDQHGSPTFAADLANVVGRLIPRLTGPVVPGEHFGIFHAVNAGETTWCGLAGAIMRGAEARGASHVPIKPITTAEYPTKARRPAYSLLSTEKLRTVHGIKLQPWESALSTCLDELIGPVPQAPPVERTLGERS